MNFHGIIMGVIMILAVGLGHIIVVKWEYHWGSRTWPGMLAVGLLLLVASLFADNMILSGGLGLFAATFLWGIHELIKQKQRVEDGLYPKKKQPVK